MTVTMNRLRPLALLVLAAALPATATAQESYPFRASLALGLGGGLDSDADTGLSNFSYQLGFSYEAEPNTLVWFRYADLDLDDGLYREDVGSGDLQYVTVAGEYRFWEGYYESGLFLGLGVYQLDTVDGLGQADDETAFGLNLGVTGEFPVAKRWSVLVELSGHWVDFERLNLFGFGHVGLVYHW